MFFVKQNLKNSFNNFDYICTNIMFIYRQRKKPQQVEQTSAVTAPLQSALPNEKCHFPSTSTAAATSAVSVASQSAVPIEEYYLPTTSTGSATEQEMIKLNQGKKPWLPIVEGDEVIITKQPLPVRRKQRDVSSWASNKRSRSHQRGESYTSKRGVIVPAKQIKNLKNCVEKCKFKCGVTISQVEREALFKAYYKMNQNEKYHYILNTTSKNPTERPKNKNQESFKKFSFKYFFNVGTNRIQVCKLFYLGTLHISQKPVYNVHKNKDVSTNTPKSDGRGKSAKSLRSLNEDVKNTVRDHIKSFPTVESHYCRATTNRTYLESNLNLVKMYKLYKEMCDEQHKESVKLSMYRHIFVSEFNLDFHIRKSDRCDLCEEYKISTSQNIVTDELILRYKKHVVEKNAMRENRKKDREGNAVPVLCFDLQNVIACPRAEISSFFYKRKLNTYNMTAHFSESKTIYCALWTEVTAGRSGNDLASAVYKILKQVALEHDFTELILWSDSCVPQNRNSYISCAVQNFIHEHPHIQKVTMKYSVPGHSCIQEVDNAHSIIEKGMSTNEFYSPLGLIRVLKGINRQHPIRVLQMSAKDFFDFESASKALNFKSVPFFQVSILVFTKILHQVSYKTSFLQCNENLTNLRFTVSSNKKARNSKMKKREGDSSIPIWRLIMPRNLTSKQALPEDKVKDIKSMFRFMPIQDREYYTTVLKL